METEAILKSAVIIGEQAQALYEANRQLTSDRMPPWHKTAYEVRKRYIDTTQRTLEALRFGRPSC